MKKVYFRTYDDKMILYTPNENHVVQQVRDGDGGIYNYIITLNIFEQIRKEYDIWEIKI
jgi:hypothetical protein